MSKKITDYKGIEYKSIRALCRAYDIAPPTYYNGLKKGLALETILHKRHETKPIRCKDHLGRHYSSERAMCKAWGVWGRTYLRRKRAGYSVLECLEGPTDGLKRKQEPCHRV